MSMDLLKDTREQWYRAFLSGDSELLQKVELPSFLYISEKGIETTEERYSKILTLVQSDKWFKVSAVKEDESIDYLVNGDTCLVTGISKITAKGNALTKVSFTELWVKCAQGWQVQCLHTSSV